MPEIVEFSVAKTTLTIDQAWSFVSERKLPGLPLDGHSLTYEQPEECKTFSLANENGKFFLKARQGVRLEDAKHYRNRSGQIELVDHRYPNHLFPFEGRHSGIRYTADGRYSRQWNIDTIGDDLIANASSTEILEYEEAGVNLPSAEQYNFWAENLERALECFWPHSHLSSDHQEDYLYEMQDLSFVEKSPGLSRAIESKLQKLEVESDSPTTVTVVRDISAHKRIARCQQWTSLLSVLTRVPAGLGIIALAIILIGRESQLPHVFGFVVAVLYGFLVFNLSSGIPFIEQMAKRRLDALIQDSCFEANTLR